jgi:predicted dehydrogenase
MQNENNKINIGILGCAKIAGKYAINAFKSLNKVDKIFIASRDINKAKKWASEFGIGFKNSYDDLINDSSIDAIYIPLPVSLHEEWAVKCAEKGKHVICEKSLASNLGSTTRIVNNFNKKGLVLFENFACDYHPQHSKILSLIKKGEIGNPLIFNSYLGFEVGEGDIRKDKKLDNTCFNDQATYIVFMSRKMFKAEPISVYGNFDDNQGTLHMTFPGNKTAFGAFGFNHAYQNNYSIWGSKGLIEIKRAYGITPKDKAIIHLFRANPKGDTSEQIEVENVNQFELIFRDFCTAIINKDDKKRMEKYKLILAQAKVMQELRDSNDLTRKVLV